VPVRFGSSWILLVREEQHMGHRASLLLTAGRDTPRAIEACPDSFERGVAGTANQYGADPVPRGLCILLQANSI